MKVKKRGAVTLLGLTVLHPAACSNATYDQSNSPFVSVFCLYAVMTRNRQIILFQWLFQTSTTIGNLL